MKQRAKTCLQKDKLLKNCLTFLVKKKKKEKWGWGGSLHDFLFTLIKKQNGSYTKMCINETD